MKRTLAAVLSLLLLTSLASVVVGCGKSEKPTENKSEPTGTINSVEQGTGAAIREANLRQIDSAVQQYYVTNGTYPTSITQLSQYFVRGVPVDPAGGTYYLFDQGGVPRAAVR
jgi:hypothetical protein